MPKDLNALRNAVLRVAANQPWAMEVGALEALLARIASGDLNIHPTAMTQALAGVEVEATGQPQAAIHPATERATARREGAVAVINVDGVIASRQSLLDWLMGVNAIPPSAIAAAQEAAVADADVKAVVTVWNTPGGVVGGVPEAFNRMFALRGNGKPMVSVANGQCASAGFWMASAAEEFDATTTAMVGSLGVYLPHVDLSGAYAKEGVVKSFVEAPLGGHKTEGNDTAPLSEDGRAHMQEMVDDIYGMFVRDVARGRGVSEAVARSETFGQGRVYLAARAQERGMIDRVRTLPETLLAFGGASNPAPVPNRGRAYAQQLMEARLRGIQIDV